MAKFADSDDVSERYEGEFPADRSDWVDVRLDDVEADLMLMVPSLALPLDQIDANRQRRAKALVCDKVLDLFRNPERSRTRTSTSGPYSDTVTSDSGRTSPKGYFTDDEVANLRLRSRRSNLGVARIKPFIPGQVC